MGIGLRPSREKVQAGTPYASMTNGESSSDIRKKGPSDVAIADYH